MSRRAELMAEARAWRLLAEYFDTKWNCAGFLFLCNEVDCPWRHEFLADLNRRMLARIEPHVALKKGGDSYASAYANGECSNNEAHGARILAALWLALEAEDEAKPKKRLRPSLEPKKGGDRE